MNARQETPQERCAKQHLEMIASVVSLREQFAIVASYTKDPVGSIRIARAHFEKLKNPLKRSFNAIEQHRAEQSLLLFTPVYDQVKRELIDLSSRVAIFAPTLNADFESLQRSVLATAAKTKPCVDHVTNCLNILSGQDKVLIFPKGPVFPV